MNRKVAKGNLRTAYVFFFFVGALIILSLFLRIAFLFKDSKFDGSSHFSLEVQNRTNKKIQIISFSPLNSTIAILILTNLDPKALEIPVDAKIDSGLTFKSENITPSLFRMFFDFKDQKQVNSIDILRMLLFSATVKNGSATETAISDQTTNISSVVSTFFIDTQIANSNLNIEVINSTSVSGLGNRLANYISNMGGNVILVATGDQKKESEIDYSKDSYTVEKLSTMLNLKKIKVQKKSLPDVTIIIGDDSLDNLKF